MSQTKKQDEIILLFLYFISILYTKTISTLNFYKPLNVMPIVKGLMSGPTPSFRKLVIW